MVLNKIFADSCSAGIYVEGNNSSQFGLIQNSQVWNITGGSKIVYGPATVGGFNNMVEGNRAGHIFVAKDSTAALQIQSFGSSFWNYVYADSINNVLAFGAEGITLPAISEYSMVTTTDQKTGFGGVTNPEHTAQIAGALALQEQVSAPDSTIGYTVIYADQNKRVIILWDDGTYDTLGVGGAFVIYDGAKRVGAGSYLADSTFADDESPSLQLDITVTPALLVACTATGTIEFIPEARDTPSSAGSDLISSSMTATTSCDTVDTFIGGDIEAGKYVVADVISVSDATGFLWMLHFTNTNDIVNSHVHDEIVSANDSNRVQVDETPGENKIRIDVAGVERGVWDETGLGLGTAAPSTPLHVVANTGHDNIRLEENSGGENWILAILANGDLVLEDEGTARVTFEDGGFVGLNTTNPANLLDMTSTGGSTNPFRIKPSSGSARFTVQENASNEFLFNIKDSGGTLNISISGNATNGSYFKVGNFGIGTDTPGTKLDVAGEIVSSISDTVASAATLILGHFNNFHITGTTGIDSFDTASDLESWSVVYIGFAAGLTITESSAKMLDFGGSGNITTSAGDVFAFQRRGNILHRIQ